MRKNIWETVVILTINEALNTKRIEFGRTIVDESPFKFMIGDHQAHARLSSIANGKEVNFATVIGYDCEADPIGSPLCMSWGTTAYKGRGICSLRVSGFLEMERGRFVYPSTHQRFECMIKRGFGDDIRALVVSPNGYEIRRYGKKV